jgi:hypothetical protein
LTLCCRAYDLTDATAPNVRLFVDQVLAEFNLKLTENQFVVSDNEPKMRCSFRENVTRVGCSCHYLNKILEKSFIHVGMYIQDISSPSLNKNILFVILRFKLPRSSSII